jgi:hypothetical protein
VIKKLISVISLLAVVSGLSLPANADQLPDEMFSLTSEPGSGYLGYTAYPDGASVDMNSGLIGMKTSNLKVESITWCNSIADANCADRLDPLVHQARASASVGTIVPSQRVVNLVPALALNQAGSI